MNTDFNLYLYEERSRSLGDHGLARLIGQSGNSLLTFSLLWMMGASHFSIIWLVGALAVTVLMFVVTKALLPEKKAFTIKRWKAANMMSSFLVGFSWGIAPAIFYLPDNTLFFIVMVAIYSGYIASSLAVSSIFKYSFIVFALGATIPFTARLFYEGGTDNTIVASLMIYFVIMMVAVSTNIHKQFIKSVETKYDNERLVVQLDHEKTLAEKAVTSKAKFLAAASHDLRQPLNAIGLFSEALVPLQTKPKGQEILTKIRQSLNGLNEMLHALLDISRLDSETVENHPKHIFLNELIEQLFEENQIAKKNIAIRVDISSEALVFVDPTIIHRILSNLIDNAIKYTKSGEIVIKCEEANDNHVFLKIIDSGIGIPEDKLEAVFEEFSQLHNHERDRQKGLGLGLSIVKRLCYIANINLNIESKVDVGTKVTLRLQQGLTQPSEKEDHLENYFSLTDKFIIVIDDEKDILEGMRYLLTSYGADVLIAESLAIAHDALQQQSSVPDLIVSDLRLRDRLSGIDAIDAIRDEYNRNIPALLVTGDTAPDRIIEAQEYPTLYKPVNPQELQQKLSELLRAT